MCAFSDNTDTVYNLQIMTLREKKPILLPQRRKGTSSKCCMAVTTSPPTPYSENTLLQIHCKAEELSELGTGGGASPWFARTACSLMRPFIPALHNYCRSHKLWWGIQMTNVRRPFKSYFWKIFLLQENAPVVTFKKKKQKKPNKNRKWIKSSRDNNQSWSLR